MVTSRRELLQSSGIVLSYFIAGQSLTLTPAQAYAAGVESTVLSTSQSATLAAMADFIAPGARKAGLSNYVDHQLAATKQECLLFIRYLGVPHPFSDFYRAALDSAENLAKTSYSKPWYELNAQQANTLLGKIASGTVENWNGPPAEFFFFVVRSDACDVLYGTREGFDRLGMPHMAHIEPDPEW